jgi:hypothetical protein
MPHTVAMGWVIWPYAGSLMGSGALDEVGVEGGADAPLWTSVSSVVNSAMPEPPWDLIFGEASVRWLRVAPLFFTTEVHRGSTEPRETDRTIRSV